MKPQSSFAENKEHTNSTKLLKGTVDMYTEEILYCDYCGGVNRPSAVECEHCQQKMRRNHSAFLIFLKSNTKDKFLGDTQDNFFKRLEKFLFSHLYGMVVSILVVTTVAVYAVPKDAHIEKITATNAPVALEEAKTPVLTVIESADKEEIWAITRAYQKAADFGLTGIAAFGGDNVESSFAESVGSFPYSGVHDMMGTGVAAAVIRAGADPTRRPAFGTRGIRTFLVNEELTSELAKTLRDDGYEVTEGVFYGGGNIEHNRPVDTGNLEACDVSVSYRIVYVKIENKWYIAEDVLL